MNVRTKCSYDLVVVGCGFTGGVVAYLASKQRKRVLLLERRGHIGGNMYDRTDPETGILIQYYGPHSFHTDDDKVYQLVQRIGGWEPYILRARVELCGKQTVSPFNFHTIDSYFSREQALKIKTHLMNYFSYQSKVTIMDLLDCKDPVVEAYARFLFQEDYLPYTAKQWGIPPEELDLSILRRVPVRLSYDDRYFDDRFQMQPKGGYTTFFQRMLDSPWITLQLNTDAQKRIAFSECGGIFLDGERLEIPLVYTGALDELFGCQYGRLPYRSLSFVYKTLDIPRLHQESPCVAYPKAEGYTRITEFSGLMPLPPVTEQTVIAYEYPQTYGTANGREPYYPILTEKSQAIYRRYAQKAEQYTKLYPCGRLGDFQYYNMDNAIQRAVQVYSALFSGEPSH